MKGFYKGVGARKLLAKEKIVPGKVTFPEGERQRFSLWISSSSFRGWRGPR